jgi:glucose dehydrogenase
MTTIVSPDLATARGQRGGLLRLAVRIDAVVSAAFGVALLAGGGALSQLLGAPSTLLASVGGVCLVYSAALLLLQTRASIPRRAAWTVVVANTVWATASVLLILFGWLPLTPVGVALVLVQAVGVAALADLQFVALLRSRS